MIISRKLINFPNVLNITSKFNQTQLRTSFYNRYRHGPTAISNPQIDKAEIIKNFFGRQGIEWFKSEIKLIYERYWSKPPPSDPVINEVDIFEHFDTGESLSRWKPVADADSFNGFSTSKIIRSSEGHALFTGFLDTRVPDDGLTQRSGFAGIIGPYAPRIDISDLDPSYRWGRFNSFEIKFRGDGRKYNIVVNTSSDIDDLSFYDTYSYPLYTRGGPQWQTLRIPLSKFVFASKGMIQDVQHPFPANEVKFVAITLFERVNGPFSLEIDYMGLVNASGPFTELSAYETYAFTHLKWKQIDPECDPPLP